MFDELVATLEGGGAKVTDLTNTYRVILEFNRDYDELIRGNTNDSKTLFLVIKDISPEEYYSDETVVSDVAKLDIILAHETLQKAYLLMQELGGLVMHTDIGKRVIRTDILTPIDKDTHLINIELR